MFFFTEPIKTFIKDENTQILYLPIFALYALQWYNDITLAFDAWTARFAEHFDFKNGMYIVGKILSSGLLFLSFVDFITDAKATPRTEDIRIIVNMI